MIRTATTATFTTNAVRREYKINNDNILHYIRTGHSTIANEYIVLHLT